MRAAYRIGYSILDKAAFFLNAYLGLGHKPTQVSFRSVWYEPKGHASYTNASSTARTGRCGVYFGYQRIFSKRASASSPNPTLMP